MRSFFPAAAVLVLLSGGAIADIPAPQFLPGDPNSYWAEADQCNQYVALAQALYASYAANKCPVGVTRISGRWRGKAQGYFDFCRTHNVGGCRAELAAMTSTLNHCIQNKMRMLKSHSIGIGKSTGAQSITGPGLLEGDQQSMPQGPASSGTPGVPSGGGSTSGRFLKH
jgi:hypothetical protein